MEHLSEQEKAVYDRQLRVWGVETQRKSVAPTRSRRCVPVLLYIRVVRAAVCTDALQPWPTAG